MFHILQCGSLSNCSRVTEGINQRKKYPAKLCTMHIVLSEKGKKKIHKSVEENLCVVLSKTRRIQHGEPFSKQGLERRARDDGIPGSTRRQVMPYLVLTFTGSSLAGVRLSIRTEMTS